jgi:hypothetical protein
MSDQEEKTTPAFQYLIRILEDAIRAGADSVGLERESGGLSVVQYARNSGLLIGPIPKELEQTLIEEIIDRSGLADNPRGEIHIELAGKGYMVIVDERSDFGESAFNLLLKRSAKARQ